jgi:hypothetical protein
MGQKGAGGARRRDRGGRASPRSPASSPAPSHADRRDRQAGGRRLHCYDHYGRGTFERCFLGSVADRVIRAAPCAVVARRETNEGGATEPPTADLRGGRRLPRSRRGRVRDRARRHADRGAGTGGLGGPGERRSSWRRAATPVTRAPGASAGSTTVVEWGDHAPAARFG